MKRELFHPACVPKPKGVTSNTDPFELAEMQVSGEEVRNMRGKLRGGCQCDMCGEEMREGDDAVARSIFTERTPWYSWEEVCLEVSI